MEDVYDMFLEFDKLTNQHEEKIRKLINKIAKIENKTPDVEAYLERLHKYYKSVHDLPPNLHI